jgi:RecJ-like exonuclease
MSKPDAIPDWLPSWVKEPCSVCEGEGEFRLSAKIKVCPNCEGRGDVLSAAGVELIAMLERRRNRLDLDAAPALGSGDGGI